MPTITGGSLLRLWPALSPRAFLIAGIAAIIISRVLVIVATPQTRDFPDPRIYQGAGQVVLSGINPYDYSDQPEMREALRLSQMEPKLGMSDFAASIDSWNYYVSGNLPASTALHGALEFLSGGSRTAWRYLLIAGDIAMLLGLLALLRSVRGGVREVSDQVAAFCLVVANPALVISGTAIPEDKQFQTALMLLSAALLLAPLPASTAQSLKSGLVLSLSVLFKLFGAFLLPLWLVRTLKERSRYAVLTILAALVPIVASLAAFGWHFVMAMSARGVRDSVQGAQHASPWTLFPWLAGQSLIIVKAVVVVLACAALIVLCIRRRIDVLNCCAGLAVAFVCIWLDKGSMDRMNIAIVFAIASLASLSATAFLAFSIAATVLATTAYGIGLGILHAHFEQVDAVLVFAFVVGYFTLLATRPRQIRR